MFNVDVRFAGLGPERVMLAHPISTQGPPSPLMISNLLT